MDMIKKDKRNNKLLNYFLFPGIDKAEKDRRRIAMIAFCITVVILFPVGIYNFAAGNFFTGLYNIVSALILTAVFLSLKYIKNGLWIYRICGFFTALLFLYDIVIGGEQEALSLWPFIFPAGTYFMYGIKESTLWNFFFLTIASILMLLSHSSPFIHHYSDFYISRFILTYSAITLLTLGYEYTRSSSIKELAQKQRAIKNTVSRMKTEFELSKNIQKNIIPAFCPRVKGLKAASLYKPLEEVSGDFFDYIQLDSHHKIGIFIADVTGHGVPSALITSMLKILIATSGNRKNKPTAMMEYINSHLYDKTGGYLVTAFYGIIDTNAMTLRYSRAAHSFPLLIRKGRISPLKADGFILGADAKPRFKEKIIKLKNNDKVLFFTDGLTETMNMGSEYFDNVINAAITRHCECGIKDFVNNIYNELLNFKGRGNFEDDITIIAVHLDSESDIK
jgi:hypothetical protein